jgi:predicted transcriptional regulator
MTKKLSRSPNRADTNSPRDLVIRALQQLPATATLDEIEDKFWFMMKISRGLEDVDAGRTIPHEEVVKYFEETYGYVPSPQELQDAD